VRDHELAAHLAELHGAHEVGDLVEVDLPKLSSSPRLAMIIEGAGFERARAYQGKRRLRRLHTLADRIAPDMRLLVVGLNPSPASADSGVGFHRPGNRFWPAMLAAGLATVDRDPMHLLEHHGIGMTDIVKRTTRRADQVDGVEFQAGFERLDALADWLSPRSVVMVGLQGWRTAIDRRAERGWQERRLGSRSDDPAGVPVYLMPSTSGLNAHDTVATLTEHLRRAAAGEG